MTDGLNAAPEQLPEKVRQDPFLPTGRRRRLDRVFFGLGLISAISLALQLLVASFDVGAWGFLTLIGFWVVLAYFVLPRLHRIFTALYVPDYFIGRTRTSDGLLGDPINLALRGSADQLATAFAAAGWTRADPVDLRSSVRIATATLGRRAYPSAPISPLFLFERVQDVGYQQEVAGNPSKRHHIRLWATPEDWLLPGGTQVDWLAGATYDRAVGLSFFTLQITHRVDANTDVERDHVVASLRDHVPGLVVENLPDFTTGYHCRNGGGDQIRTDGDLPILDLRQIPATHHFVHEAPPSKPPMATRAGAVLSLAFVTWTILALYRLTLWPINNWMLTAVALMSLLGLLTAAGVVPLLRGSDRARVNAMLAAVASVPLSVIYALAVPELDTSLLDHVGSAVVTLMLIILSSESARDWAARNLKPRTRRGEAPNSHPQEGRA